MKKTLALVLSLLVAFSMFSVVAAAATEVTVKFVVDGEVVETLKVAPGTAIIPDLVPEVVREYTAEKDGKTFKYTFKGWKSSENQNIYYDKGIPTPTGDAEIIVYEAQYAEEDYSERQSFWNLVESIFERLNKIFEYFATIFNW